MAKVIDYSELVSFWDSLTKQGEVKKVSEHLEKLSVKNIPRQHKLPIANIALRTHQFNIGLKILTPIVLAEEALVIIKPHPEEIVLYAVFLQKIGMVSEALKMLSKVDSHQVPKAHLYRAFCYFNLWDHKSAIPELGEYCRNSKISEYDRLVGKVNLLSALIADKQLKTAMETWEEINQLSEEKGYSRLVGNGLELKSQIYLFEDKLDLAEKCLRKAADLFTANNVRDQLYILKWLAYVEAKKIHNISPLQSFKKTAFERGHWETMRECDYLSLRVKFDNDLFSYLYYGTPYVKYRERLDSEFGEQASLSEAFLIGNQNAPILDIERGTWQGKNVFNKGRFIHKLVAAMFLDLYSPLRIGSIFSLICSGEVFNINSSPGKIHQLVHRTRNFLEDESIPISIKEQAGSYSARWSDKIGIILGLQKKLETREEQFLKVLRQKHSGLLISRSDVMKCLDMSLSTATRLINSSIAQGLLVKKGSGSQIKYEFVDKDDLSIEAA